MKKTLLLLALLSGSCSERVIVDREREIELSYMILVEDAPSDTVFILRVDSTSVFQVEGSEFRMSFWMPPRIVYSWDGDSVYSRESVELGTSFLSTPDSNKVLRVRRLGNSFSITVLPSWTKFRTDFITLHKQLEARQ